MLFDLSWPTFTSIAFEHAQLAVTFSCIVDLRRPQHTPPIRWCKGMHWFRASASSFSIVRLSRSSSLDGQSFIRNVFGELLVKNLAD